MHLKEMIDTRDEQEPIWVAYPPSKTFQVLVRPLAGRQSEFAEKARKVEWDEATMQKKVVIDEELYLKLFNAHVIADWKGLFVQDLKRLVLLEKPGKLRSFKEEVACDELSKLLLMQHSTAFSAFINRACVDIERFNEEREEAEKKSS